MSKHVDEREDFLWSQTTCDLTVVLPAAAAGRVLVILFVAQVALLPRPHVNV